MPDEVPAHEQRVTRRYTLRYPAHDPRESDPHYRAFEAYRKATVATAKCHIAEATGTDRYCKGPLELHHRILEFAMINGVDFDLLAKDFPSIKNPDDIAAWAESPENLRYYCEFHHRGDGGIHVASSSDFEAQFYILGLIE